MRTGPLIVGKIDVQRSPSKLGGFECIFTPPSSIRRILPASVRSNSGPGTRNRFLFVSPLTRQRPESPSLLLTLCHTVWYTLQCGIHRIAGIYSAAPSASRCVGRRGFASHTRGFAQESREG